MSSDEFDEPTEEFTGVRINPRDALGHLLMIWAIEYLPHKPTQYSRPDKPSDVIVVDVVDLDVPDPETNQPGLLARHVWWRQAKLIQSLKTRIGTGRPLLAYMTQGGATTGFNRPFVLNSATGEPAAVQRANDWRARNPSFKPSEPFQLPDDPQPQVEVETSQPTQLESMATSSLVDRLKSQQAAGVARLPRPPDQGPIPF